MNKPDEILTAKQVAFWLKMTEAQVQAKARAGEIPHFMVGRWRRFRRSAVQAWVNQQEQGG